MKDTTLEYKSTTPYMGGKFHRLKEDLGALPAGIVVYCIVDTGDEFRIRTDRPYWGVQEFIFESHRKWLFEPYG